MRATLFASTAILALVLASCSQEPTAQTVEPVSQNTENEVAETVAPDPARMRAEINADGSIRVMFRGDAARSTDPADYRLSDGEGNVLPISTVLPTDASGALIFSSEALDPARVYFVEELEMGLRARARFDGWFRTLYSDKPLGANIAADGSATDFRIFAPRADRIRLYLYEGPDDGPEQATSAVWMQRDANGVFEAQFEGDLHGVYYDFTVHGPNDPGNQFYATEPVHISDPYARVNVDGFGKSRVWRATIPATPLANGRPPMQDVVSYEVHVQDFTDLLPVADELGSSIPAFATPGLTNSRGEPIGFDHLVNLGINTVHLLPMQEFIHYPTEEWAAGHGDVPILQELGIAHEDYQWGYRTTHAFAIESRYRQTGTDWGAQRDQFRDLVQAFHDRGIAVIIDIVPNHTGESMEDRDTPLNFSGLDRFYYYRLNEDGVHIGTFGNEVKTEDRPMVQRWLIDQCRQLIEEFGIDGFRIDLAGQIDEQTLYALRRELGEDVIIYGEPWIDVNDPWIREMPDWDWYKEDAPITFFQDNARDAFVGSPFVLENPATDLGWSGGNAELRERVMTAIANSFDDEPVSPNQGLNYMDIHDNWTLADRFALSDWDGRNGVNEPHYRIAAGLLFTSLGPVVIHGGSEFMRSKGIAPLHEQHVETDYRNIHLKGREDTFNVRTPNQFVWENIGATADEAPADYAGMLDWWRGLIHFRLSDEGQVFRIAEHREGHVRWFTPDDGHLLAYTMGDSVLVAANVGSSDAVIPVDLPDGNWVRIADGEVIDAENGVGGTLDGGREAVAAPAGTLQIWVRR
ncbi:MAG: alpha-amylase family glycosyl hydrolase [Maricaulis sp.]|uniref:alpha-amylase family glycosyl hydrolase n=1 Tax=Maricaulis sp. TaxID=1486257 RepID=UPI0026117CA1|nr:alpha-amylase family glycosyl hydrolase [Maricaulis sp.]MDM7984170.1 alpha-amylase family glycosyl hydrolase [Maricaulis sp.]